MLLTLVGVALGVAIVVAIYVMDHNTIQSRLRSVDPQRGQVDLEVQPVDTSATVTTTLASLRELRGVRGVAVWAEARAVARGPGGELDLAVFGLGPLPADGFAHYVVARGRDLAAADGEEPSPGVLLGEAAAQALGVEVGGTITLAEPPAMQRVVCKDGKLVAVPSEPGRAPFQATLQVVGVLAAERLGKREQQRLAVVALPFAERLRPVGGKLFHLRREEGADLDRLKQELQGRFTVVDARSALIGEGADERAFRNGLKVLGGLALLLGMYVVFQTLSHSLVARIRQLGLLRCLGTGTGAITRIFLFDALLLGVVGSALGIGLGMLLALWLQRERISSLGLGKDWQTFEIPWFPVGWTAVLGVLFTLAGAMFPLVRARQLPALDILRAGGQSPGGDDGVDLMRGVHHWMFGLLVVALPAAYLGMTPLAVEEGGEMRMVLLQLVGILAMFGTVLLLAPGLTSGLGRLLLLPLRAVSPMAAWLVHKVLGRSAGRIAASVCGLAAVLLAVLGLKSLTHSLHAEVSVFGARALERRVFVTCQPSEIGAVRAAARVRGVAGLEVFEGEERGGGFLLRGLDTAAAGGRDRPLEQDQRLLAAYDDPARRTMVVSTRLAKVKGWQPGALVPLRDKNGAPVSYEVLAVDDRAGFDSDERAFAITAPRWLRTDFCIPDTCVTRFTVCLAEGADDEQVGASVRSALATATGYKTGAFLEGYLRRDIQRDFRLFDLLLFLMLVLAGVGLVNGMTIAMLGRIRELGVLRALGTRRWSLCASFVLEGLVVAALASVLACGLGVLMAQVLVRGMNTVARLEAPVTLPWQWFLLVPVLAFGTALVASLVPALRALRTSPAESVRYE